ncbi:MAG TPA: hypothetical protein VER03_24485 [Bryobacteraceae bacterium]|nr:hypothetical protein [Bryobacteraceae bacterium]
MAATAAILTAVAKSAWRNLRATGSFAGNNLTVMIALMMAQEPVDRPSSTAVWYLFIGLMYAVPMGQRLTEQIPALRLKLWPLSPIQRSVVYLAGLVLNPIFPLAVLFTLLSRHPIVGAAMFAFGAIVPLLVVVQPGSLRVLRSVPRFPGRLGGLIQNHVREMLQTLDVPLAALLAMGGIIYRVSGGDPFASVVLGPMIVLVLSTLSQAHLQFDGGAMRTRARLLPITGWELLASRDAAWFAIVLVLGAGYRPAMVCCAAFVTAAIGHQTLLEPPVAQRRWQFSSGRLWPTGVAQFGAVMAAGGVAYNFAWAATAVASGVYGVSLWWYGRRWDTPLR